MVKRASTEDATLLACATGLANIASGVLEIKKRRGLRAVVSKACMANLRKMRRENVQTPLLMAPPTSQAEHVPAPMLQNAPIAAPTPQAALNGADAAGVQDAMPHMGGGSTFSEELSAFEKELAGEELAGAESAAPEPEPEPEGGPEDRPGQCDDMHE